MHEILLPSNRLIRLWNTYRHPRQAALLARMPVLGRRVPARRLWRRWPVRRPAFAALSRPASRIVSSVRDRRWEMPDRAAMQQRRQRPAHAVEPAAKSLRDGSRRAARQLRSRRPTIWLAIPAAAALGALAMYFADASQGRRRRARVRDRLAHFRRFLTSTLPRRVARRGRFFGGVARGIRHHAAHLVHRTPGMDSDDETLVARVRSEVLRAANLKSGQINIDAHEGCVTLRGQIEHPGDIRRLVGATERVEGVREVRSYLHLPDEPPPNKADIYEHARPSTHAPDGS